eukprot:COSAG02_NODE_936_length_15800_cov_56.762945_10_plen_43_part_00
MRFTLLADYRYEWPSWYGTKICTHFGTKGLHKITRARFVTVQ